MFLCICSACDETQLSEDDGASAPVEIELVRAVMCVGVKSCIREK